jgi:hypothetical protein
VEKSFVAKFNQTSLGIGRRIQKIGCREKIDCFGVVVGAKKFFNTRNNFVNF